MRIKKIVALSGIICLVLMVAASTILAACTPTATPTPVPTPTPTTPASTQTPTPTTAPTVKPTQTTAPTPQKEILLTALSPWPRAFKQTDGFYMWVDYVNKIGKGKVQIKILGGPEVIPALDQFQAIRNNIVDITLTAGGHHQGTVPESQFMSLSPWPTPKFTDTAKRERAAGLIALMTDVYHGWGTHYLGRTLLFSPVYMFQKQPVNKPADIKGRKIRSLARYNGLVEAFGGVPVGMLEAEMYTALQSGLIEALVHSPFSLLDFNWIDFTKYGTPEPFFEQDCWVQINLQKWNSLSKEVQDLLSQSILYAEDEYATKYYQGLTESVNNKLLAAGLKYIALSPEDSRLWQETLHAATLKMLQERAKPEYLARFLEIRKKA